MRKKLVRRGLPKNAVSHEDFEDLILGMSPQERRPFRLSKNGYRFPVAGGGRKVYIFYTIGQGNGRRYIAPKYARGNTKLIHGEEAVFSWEVTKS